MSKKKKRKDENKETSGYIVELKGIALVLISIIGLCPFGIVADFIKGFSNFLFGSLWAVFLVFVGVAGIFTIIKRKLPKIFVDQYHNTAALRERPLRINLETAVVTAITTIFLSPKRGRRGYFQVVESMCWMKRIF